MTNWIIWLGQGACFFYRLEFAVDMYLETGWINKDLRKDIEMWRELIG